ncbi:hypothetical protein HOV44_gp081 [Rheinheimera phage Barba5S]|jgi:hypothetical protein|uniref:Uncharacterized protein n=2 Tax=Barbavirus barba5S TaxID=2734093 RepID=A0A4P8N5G8_9CAUD|nr:hypothetical protein HOV44_gp081 [Rheinheimera phage Barba5S]QCQ59159.1 hypothetical protein Barba5S_gp081 [Rheinheimera phage Barba5S]QCQ61088.1 hypothetical protein Barba15A_gp079 [Rheinheimera phage vB_RspM_Barba15A]
MKIEDLTLTKNQYIVRDKQTGELFQYGRMFDEIGHAKNAYYQDRWFSRQNNLPSRFDDQTKMEIAKVELQQVVKEVV